jgi:predicted Zn-dependent protease
MAINTKTSETVPARTDASVADKLSEGIGLLAAGRLEEAAVVLKDVQDAAAKQGLLGLVRTARSHLAAVQARVLERGEGSRPSLEMNIQLLLNRKEAAAALESLAGALAKDAGRASLHYLKAVAHAQLGQGPESAEALGRALELDPDLIYQFRLEPDFDAVRGASAFVALHKG